MNPEPTLRCIIADDEPLALKLLQVYVDRTPWLSCAGAYTSAPEALQAIMRGEADVAFLDIQMPSMTGLEIAKAATETAVKVIFVTAHRDFAVEGFRVNALDYLLKPVSYQEFLESARRALQTATPQPEPEQTHILVRSDYRQLRISLNDILYIESLKDYVKIYLESRPRPVITQMSMKAAESMLPPARFMRIHRSFIVNLERVSAIDRGGAIIEGLDAPVPVGETYRPQFLEYLRL